MLTAKKIFNNMNKMPVTRAALAVAVFLSAGAGGVALCGCAADFGEGTGFFAARDGKGDADAFGVGAEGEGAGGGGANGAIPRFRATGGSTSGPAFKLPDSIATTIFDESAAVKFDTKTAVLAPSSNGGGAGQGNNGSEKTAVLAPSSSGAAIDASHVAQGYVGARGSADVPLRLQVSANGESYQYNLPSDGSPIFAPVNLGNGDYTFSILANTQGDEFEAIGAVYANVQLDSEFAPFLAPNIFSDYLPYGPITKRAVTLAAGAQNSGAVTSNIYQWIVNNVKYDSEKATRLANETGYVPNPDETVTSGSGICFDYAALTAAMFRSLGIPCKVVVGYVSNGPDERIYHAWNMVYIDGGWGFENINVRPNEWSLIDPTFDAAKLEGAPVGDGVHYEPLRVY